MKENGREEEGVEWSQAYDGQHVPTEEEIRGFIGYSGWEDLNAHLKETYGLKPQMSYSGCSMQQGWNMKYRKSGRSLCTLYPMEGYFIALVVIGERAFHEAEAILPLLSPYTRQLYENTAVFQATRWLMVNVTEDAILRDVKVLIDLRAKTRNR